MSQTPPLAAYLWLAGAIVAEVLGTTFLQKSAQFTRLWPSLATAVFYITSFYLLSHVLKTMPVGIAYALWSALGVVLTAVIGLLVFGQRLDGPALAGIGLIVLGVAVINLFSKSVAH